MSKFGDSNGQNKMEVLKILRSNLETIRKYINLIRANLDRNREETISAISEVGYTLEDIKRIQEQYCSDEKFFFLSTHINEMHDIISKLQNINEKVIYGKGLNPSHKDQSGEMALYGTSILKNDENEGEMEYVVPEIIPPEEAERMYREMNDRKREEDTQAMFQAISDNHNRAKARAFRQKMAEMANEGNNRHDGKRHAVDYRDVQKTRTNNRTKPSGRKPRERRDIKSQPKNSSRKRFARRLMAGALAISFIAGACTVYRDNERKADIEQRIEYVDNIIDKNGTAKDYAALCGIDFSDKELEQFLEVEKEIDSFQVKESTELHISDIFETAQTFQEVYKDIVRERLEESYGIKLNNDEIEVVRARDNIDGKVGDYNEIGSIKSIGSREHINVSKMPKELVRSIIAAYGCQGIESPTMSIEQMMYKLDNQEITKVEASNILKGMLDDMKELMTRQYVSESYKGIKEVGSIYNTGEQTGINKIKISGERTQSIAKDDDERGM